MARVNLYKFDFKRFESRYLEALKLGSTAALTDKRRSLSNEKKYKNVSDNRIKDESSVSCQTNLK